METLIGKLRATNPEVVILLGQVMLQGSNYDAYRAGLGQVAQDKSTAQSPVVIVDHHDGWDPALHTYDGVHPNELGEERMSRSWFARMAPFLEIRIKVAVTRQADELHLSFPAVEGITYSLYRSTDLTKWELQGQALAEDTSHTFTHPLPPSRRYFFKVGF
ncbi:MAG: hypothetical protein ACP5I4_03320 [Oceanipulchritudo sp.]